MSDHSEYARLAEGFEAGEPYVVPSFRKLVVEALHFRANAMEEVIAKAICCGEKDNSCNAARHSGDHDMSDERYAQIRGCESEEVFCQARAVLAALEGTKP